MSPYHPDGVRDDTWTTRWLQLQWWHASLNTSPREDSTLGLLSSLLPSLGSLMKHMVKVPQMLWWTRNRVKARHTHFQAKKKKKATNWNASVFLIPWEAEQCTHKEAGETMWPYQILVEHCSPLQVPGSSPWQVIPGSASSWQDLCLGHQSPRSRHFNLENEEYTITMSLLTMELLRAGTLDLPNHWQETAHLVMPAWQPHFSHRWNGTAASWAVFNSSHLQTNTQWLRVILRVDRGLSFVLGEQCVWLPEWRGKPNQVDRQHPQTSKH